MVPIIRIAILAAGQASRFGANKLLQHWRDRPLLSYALEAASQVRPGNVFVVTGADAKSIAPVCESFAADTVFNPDFANGIGTSIASAARTCDGKADGMLLLLGDQPLISTSHLGDLINRWNGDPHRICASRYSETLGPPVLFGSAYFQQLAELKGDGGARELIKDNDQVVALDFPAAAYDVDELADVSELDKFLTDSE